MVAFAELFILYRPSQHNDRWKESTARPTTCNHRAGQEQEASCKPAAARNRAANLCEFSYVNTENKFMAARFFLANPVLHNSELQSCVIFRVSTLKTFSGKHWFSTWNLTGVLCGLLSASQVIRCVCSVFDLVGNRRMHCVVCCQQTQGWPWERCNKLWA